MGGLRILVRRSRNTKTQDWIVLFLALVLGNWIGSASSSVLCQTPSGQRIESFPPPNDSQILKIQTVAEWTNPFVIVNRDGYELIVHSEARNRARLNLRELEQTLSQLPAEGWPLGRVIAVAENGLRSPGDDMTIASKLKQLKRMVQSYKLRVDQWPSG